MVTLFKLRSSITYALGCWFLAFTAYAWNSFAHQVIAQIAYDNLSADAKVMCSRYLYSPKSSSLQARFLAASVWLDSLRSRGWHQYDSLHYVYFSFPTDNRMSSPVASRNALWGIKQAITILSTKNTHASDKRLALRLLLHLVGDLHQPLHTINKISPQLPRGDLGGNLFFLGTKPLRSNLHQYWDQGAGIFLGPYDKNQVKNKARQLEKRLTCALVDTEIKPEQWAQNSYDLALSQAYTLHPGQLPTRKYQLNAQSISQQQVIHAGCRLAALLNSLVYFTQLNAML